jgi:hypothetical protein
MAVRGKTFLYFSAALFAFAGCGGKKNDGEGTPSGQGGNPVGNGGAAGSGAGGANGGKAGAAAAAGVGGTSGASATAGVGGTSGSAGARWDAACDGTTTNGRCDGDVFVWCDYYTKGLRTFDCATLGMTCQADARQPPESEVNGCVAGPCPASGQITCDGRFIRDCAKGLLHVTDCEKTAGPGALCRAVEDSHVCLGGVSCGPPSTIRCDGAIEAICNEYGQLRAYDCSRCNPLGTCGGDIDGCTPSRYDCDLP